MEEALESETPISNHGHDSGGKPSFRHTESSVVYGSPSKESSELVKAEGDKDETAEGLKYTKSEIVSEKQEVDEPQDKHEEEGPERNAVQRLESHSQDDQEQVDQGNQQTLLKVEAERLLDSNIFKHSQQAQALEESQQQEQQPKQDTEEQTQQQPTDSPHDSPVHEQTPTKSIVFQHKEQHNLKEQDSKSKAKQSQKSNLQELSHSQTHPRSLRVEHSYSTRESLKTIFQHYSKLSYTTGRNMTFERMQHESNILNIHKYMIWCKDFKVVGQVPTPNLMDIFKKAAQNYKEMDFQNFMAGLEKIASIMFKSKKVNKQEEMEKFLHVSTDQDFREKCKELNISIRPSVSSNKRVKIARSQRPEGSSEGRMKKMKSESIRKKMSSNMERYDFQKNNEERLERSRAINKSVNSHPLRLKIYSQKHESASYQSRQPGRYSKAELAMDRYQLNSVVSQARNEISTQENHFKKNILQELQRTQKVKTLHRPLFKPPQERQVFLSNLMELDEEDEFLAAHERQHQQRRVANTTNTVNSRIEEIRRLEEHKQPRGLNKPPQQPH